MNNTLIIGFGLLVLIVLILYVLMNNSSNTVESFSATPDPSATQLPPPVCPTPRILDWWDSSPVKSIISKYSGVSINVRPAAYQSYSGGNLDSDYQVLIESSNKSIPEGVLSVGSDGTFSKSLNNPSDTNQLWKIKQIKTAEDLRTLVNKPSLSVSNTENYPYFMLVTANSISSTNVRALQYENGTLSVRLVGDYISQQWDVNKVNTIPGIPILDNNQLSNFSPEYMPAGVASSTAMLNAATNSQIMNTLNQILGFVQSTGINNAPSQSVFGTTGASSAPLTVNIKLGSNASRAVSTTGATSVSNFANTDARTLLKQYDDAQLGKMLGTKGTATAESLNGLCATPNMSDYISKVGIPCTACANF